MGQQANSHRHASLDDKKIRAAGRQQNQILRQMSGREMPPQVPGAFGAEGKAEKKRRSPSGRTERRP